MTFLDTIKNKINNAQIISFDIFDTLLLRPYVEPVDLFKHLEKLYAIENFSKVRIEAEKAARKKYSQNIDININQIYECMPDDMQEMKAVEINFEKQVLTPHAEMKEVFDYAKSKNKKIVIASDMYLPHSVLSDILALKGYLGYSKLYVSGDCLKAKFNGSMYDLIIQDFNVRPEKIFHIGDNKRADYQKAIEKGIQAVLIPKMFERLCEMNHRAKIFYERNRNNLSASILLGLVCISLSRGIDIQKNYWHYFGAVYGGAVCYAFIKFVEENAVKNNIDKLLFIARDGYVLRKVFDLIKSENIEGDYIYAPRTLSLKCTLDYERRAKASKYELKTVAKHLIDIYKEEYPEDISSVASLNTADKKLAFINAHKDKFEQIAQKELKKYHDYLCNFNIEGKNIAMVDTITTYFAAQSLIKKALDKNILGIYWVTNLVHFPDAEKYYNLVSFVERKRMNTVDWRIMEFIMTSPEAPIACIDKNKPVYKTNINKKEAKRMKLFPDVEAGILDFAKLKQEVFGKTDIYFTNPVVTDWINLFCSISTKYEKKIFKEIGSAFDCNHDDYILFPTPWFKVKPATTLQNIFSVRNEESHKVVRCLGLKFKFRRNYKKENKMKLYSEKIYDNKKRIRVLGVTVYKKENKPDFVERKYLGGLIKSKKNERQCKLYFLGIQIYKKDKKFDLYKLQRSIDAIAKRTAVLQDFENRIIRRLTQVNQRLITASVLHQKTFAKWKAAFRGKTVVLVGAGPTVNYFEPVEGAVYVGCNRAFMFDKVDFDILFSIDKAGIDRWYDEFFEYRKDKCIKFIGDQNLGVNFQIPENKIPLENVYRYITYAGIDFTARFNLDIATSPLHNAASVSLHALQFILYTQPEKIYIVGIDCTGASKTYFKTDGNELDNAKRGEDAARLDRNNVNFYKQIKQFAETYYPDTEIISVNPVGLKGIFKDVYTNSYLEQNPDLREQLGEDICILNECANGDDYLLSV